jgi:negative regulator of sigma E activity
VSSPRTVIVGSAVPLLLIAGFVCLPATRQLLRNDPAGRSPSAASANFGPTSTSSAASKLRSATVKGSGRAVASGLAVAALEQARAVRRLRRSMTATQSVGFSGTEGVTVHVAGASLTRQFRLVQRPGGDRTVTLLRSSGDAGTEPAADDALSAVSDRALAALSAAYQLKVAGTGRIAGRPATVVTAVSNGRPAASLWLDNASGLLLREDVRDSSGKVFKTAELEQLRLSGSARRRSAAANTIAETGISLNQTSASSAQAGSPVWGDDLSAAQLQDWRAADWPSPQQIAPGFVLLDAQSGTSTADVSMLHLIYGNGLSTVSLFLERGQLDPSGLAGLTKTTWGDGVVYERDGWPEVMVWQSGKTVITAVGDVEPVDLRAVLKVLAPHSGGSPLESLNHVMRSGLGWLRG